MFYCLNKRLFFLGNSLVVQGIRWCFHCCRPSSVSDWGTKIPQAVHGQKKKKRCFGVFCGFQVCIQAHSDGHHAPPSSLLGLIRNLAVE